MNNCIDGIRDLSDSPIVATEDDIGCAYVVDESDGWRSCGPEHHALCHIACGTKAETDRLREVEALASAVGGRRARQRTEPSRQFLNRLEQAVREVC